MSDAIAVATAVQRAVEQATDARLDVQVREAKVAKSQEGGGFDVTVRLTPEDADELAGTGGGGSLESGGSAANTGADSVSPVGAPASVDALAEAAVRTDPGEPPSAVDGDGDSDESEPDDGDFECLNDGCDSAFASKQARAGHMATCEPAGGSDGDGDSGATAPEDAEMSRFDYIRANGPCVASAGPDTDAACGFGAAERGDPYCPKHDALKAEMSIQHSTRALAAHDAWAHGRDAELETFIDELTA